MSTDVLALLRDADPCPDPLVYDEFVAQSNIDVIVRADLTVGGSVVPLRRRHHRAWLAVAAVAVLLAVAGTVVGLQTSGERTPPMAGGTGSVASTPVPGPDTTARFPGPEPGSGTGSWTTFSADGITFEHPARWVSYPDTEGPAPVLAVVTYLSTSAVPAATCVATSTMTSCHPPSPSLLGGGVFVTWTVTSVPNQELPADGADSTIAGRAAKVVSGDVRDCPMGAVDGVSAVIASGDTSWNLLYVGACFGPGEDLAADRVAVDRMLASLRITP